MIIGGYDRRQPWSPFLELLSTHWHVRAAAQRGGVRNISALGRDCPSHSVLNNFAISIRAARRAGSQQAAAAAASNTSVTAAYTSGS